MKYLITFAAIFAGLASLSVAYASEKNATPDTTPIIEFYKKEGVTKFDCMIPMTAGVHSFQRNACTNDDDYYFIIRYPREGIMFGIYDDPNCNPSSAWVVYRIFDPIYTKPTDILVVDAGYAIHDGGVGTEIVPGIYSVSHDDGHRQLPGKVSCMRIFQGIHTTQSAPSDHKHP